MRNLYWWSVSKLYQLCVDAQVAVGRRHQPLNVGGRREGAVGPFDCEIGPDVLWLQPVVGEAASRKRREGTSRIRAAVLLRGALRHAPFLRERSRAQPVVGDAASRKRSRCSLSRGEPGQLAALEVMEQALRSGRIHCTSGCVTAVPCVLEETMKQWSRRCIPGWKSRSPCVAADGWTRCPSGPSRDIKRRSCPMLPRPLRSNPSVYASTCTFLRGH